MQIYYEFFISATISSSNMTRDSNELIKEPELTIDSYVKFITDCADLKKHVEACTLLLLT